jgi:probable HAF family extracellular repeat protein
MVTMLRPLGSCDTKMGTSRFCILLALGMVIGPGPGHAESLYSVTPISIYALALNDLGQVAGESDNTAAIWANGSVTMIGKFGSAISAATGINDAGQIIGVSVSATTRGFLYDSGRVTDVGTLGGTNVFPTDINNAGQVAGYANTSAGFFPYHAFLYSNGAITDLGTLGGPNSSFGYGINNSGQVVGSASLDGTNHAFLYSNGEMIDLGTLGGAYSIAWGINNTGQIVGQAETSSGGYDPFLYSGGTMTDLGTLGGNLSYAKGINDNGKIVGLSMTRSDSYTPRAFLYNEGRMVDLNTLIEPGSNPALSVALAINNAGQILAEDYNGSSYLLTPVPECSAWLLCMGGLLALFGAGCLRRDTCELADFSRPNPRKTHKPVTILAVWPGSSVKPVAKGNFAGH